MTIIMTPSQSIIAIPALNPPDELYGVVKGIRSTSNRIIIIFNDGSDRKFDSLFSKITSDFSSIVYLKHEANCGKGKTIKEMDLVNPLLK